MLESNCLLLLMGRDTFWQCNSERLVLLTNGQALRMIRRSIVPRVILRSNMASVSSRATRMDKRSFLACQSPMKLNSSQTTGLQTQSHNLTSTTPVLFRLCMYFLELWLPPFCHTYRRFVIGLSKESWRSPLNYVTKSTNT
jgi:hypothetical protein